MLSKVLKSGGESVGKCGVGWVFEKKIKRRDNHIEKLSMEGGLKPSTHYEQP